MDFYSKPDTKAPKRREFIWLSAPCHLGYSEGSELLFQPRTQTWTMAWPKDMEAESTDSETTASCAPARPWGNAGADEGEIKAALP